MKTKTIIERFGPLAARILVALIFVVSGLSKLYDPAGTAGYIASKGLVFPMLLAICTGLLELGGGLSVLLGLRARWGALALAAFLVPATVIFHSPVGLTGMEAQLQMIQVMKNLAIIGGLVAVAASGSTAFSLDARLATRRRRRTEQPA